jgi:hypothetical protein
MLCIASVNALQIVLSNSLCESTAKWETSNFQRGQIVGICIYSAFQKSTKVDIQLVIITAGTVQKDS